jgi:hypothetical protein
LVGLFEGDEVDFGIISFLSSSEDEERRPSIFSSSGLEEPAWVLLVGCKVFHSR